MMPGSHAPQGHQGSRPG